MTINLRQIDEGLSFGAHIFAYHEYRSFQEVA